MIDGWLDFLPRLLGALSLVAVAIAISAVVGDDTLTT